jgi:MFS family permease
VAGDVETIFFKPIDPLQSAAMIGQALGVAFLGYALTIAIGSPLLDVLGMQRLLPLSSLCFIAGTLIVMFAGSIAHGPEVYWVIWGGCLVMGLGWGLTETVINPLTATLYPDDKTHKLNTLHASWAAWWGSPWDA